MWGLQPPQCQAGSEDHKRILASLTNFWICPKTRINEKPSHELLVSTGIYGLWVQGRPVARGTTAQAW